MPTSSLAPPPRAAPPPAAATVRPAARPPVRRWDSDGRYRRVLAGSVVVSAAVHLLILILSPAFLRVGSPPGETDTPYDPAAVSAMRMIDPEAIALESTAPTQASQSVPEPAQADPRETVPLPARAAPAPQPRSAPVRGPTPAPASAEPATPAMGDNPLRPGFRDPRLYVPPRELPPPPEPTDHERYMAHLQSRLDAYNDSIGAEAERARKATDWTVKDKNGGRWGVSPGKVHLGGVTLPLPVGLESGDNATRMREEDEKRQRAEIDRQERDREQRDVMKERIRATRERKDAERKAKRPPGG